MADVITRLYQQFDPVRPLGAHEDNLYVDWQSRTGVEDIKRTAVRSVLLAGDAPTTTLITGHRGVGKTTEMIRMKVRLESGEGEAKHFVSMLRGQDWLDLDDIRAEDIVFQTVRQLVSDLNNHAGVTFRHDQIKEWGKALVDWLKTAGIDGGGDWLKISLSLKDFPAARDDFRAVLRGQLPTLIDTVNERLLKPAKQQLARAGTRGGIVVIVDDLDKIRPRAIADRAEVTNQEQIFVHESELLRALDCDAIYSIPIELAYSHAQNDLVTAYGARPLHLPVIALTSPDNQPSPEGRSALLDIYARRVAAAGAGNAAVFEDDALRDDVLLSTGGYVRSLGTGMREALRTVDTLPITRSAVATVFNRLARDMRRGLEPGDRELIDEVAASGAESDNPAFFRLLRSGYLLAYQDDGSDWYAPHPWLRFDGTR
ncbi:MAG: hypothetical protein V9G19_02295 [Tetrasphaera sp.]